MTENISRISEGFLSESREFIENPDALSASAAAELYDMSEILVKSLSLNRQTADMSLRVELCRGLDAVLERIIDAAPSRGGTREKRVRGVYTPAAHRFRRWHNSELMKDKGLTGYMLALELGGSPVMFFGDGKEEYPYLPNLPGIALPRTDGEEGGAEIYSRHLTENYEDMDVLVLHGMYSETAAYLDAYRALRPDGKVYCGLDMSRYWMCKTDWGGRDAVRFASQCNLTATSCRSLRDALNADPNVSFPCRFMPNGFYNPNGGGVSADAGEKRNVILTVGRIGSPEKNNAELMLAFALCSSHLPEWSLRLVGPVDEKFHPFIEKYFAARPELRERVFFTGEISDKAELYREYARAKIFALTSKSEGGAPNVYAEALRHGCMFITSDIDAADDITDGGELGLIYRYGDTDGLAGAILRLCGNAGLEDVRRHIHKALGYAAKFYDWNRNAKKLAFALMR